MGGLGFQDYSPERQLWIQANSDVYIDAGLAEAQWHAWGKPNIFWIPGGHMTFALYIDEITQRIESFRRGLSAPR